jgi:hypothetical protein
VKEIIDLRLALRKMEETFLSQMSVCWGMRGFHGTQRDFNSETVDREIPAQAGVFLS